MKLYVYFYSIYAKHAYKKARQEYTNILFTIFKWQNHGLNFP